MMQSALLAVTVTGLLAGCVGLPSSDEFPGPYYLAIRLDGEATRGDVEIDVTVKQDGKTLHTRHHEGSPRVDFTLFNETVPAGKLRVESKIVYTYASTSGSTSSEVYRSQDSEIDVVPSNCGTGANVVFIVDNDSSEWESVCEGPTR